MNKNNIATWSRQSSKTSLINNKIKDTIKNIKMGGYVIGSRKKLHTIWIKWSFLLIIMKLNLRVKTFSKVKLHFQKSRRKKYIFFPTTNVGNLSCPKIIKTLSPLTLLLFIFQNFTSISQEKLIMKYGQKYIQTPHFKFYVILTKGSMEPFMGYHIYWDCWFW